MDVILKKAERALRQLEQGDVDQGLNAINELLDHRDMTDELRFELATALYSQGFVSEAIAILRDLYTRYPAESELMVTLAEYYAEDGQEDEALSHLREVPAEDDNYLRAVLLSAEISLRQGLTEVAEHKIRQAQSVYPEEKVLYQALGEIYYEQEEYALALLNFQKGTHTPLAKLADCYAHLGQLEEALTHYELALKQHRTPDVLFGAGFVAFRLKEWERAVNYFRDLLDIDPYYASAYVYLAQSYLKLNDIGQALATIEQGLRYDETNPQLFYLHGEVLLKQKKYEEAENALRYALELEPGHAQVLEALIQLSQETGDLRQCLAYLRQLLDISPERPDLWIEQGRLYEELEEWHEARDSYRQALTLVPDDVNVLNRLAYLLRDEGQLTEAVRLWKKSLVLQPDQWEIMDMIERYEQDMK
ncbi:tetratricopeptide (TPR) repeat protein [Caldalkalibacillus uzonensis]|uniref:Tetratricopeptide (TPR) repeat protein n=1 Tax=Caldalkalibacillus uzonensis TaxID=353224 RepID=A0ABU0CMJ3_9BACI|nr:tetratricopeptide repeat protein [Caldalkalibacillus uzonensis]MDQ0337642.1 tetratricopeptide (TPR) repeat protein [Caldalkalibacillus uzonensis]